MTDFWFEQIFFHRIPRSCTIYLKPLPPTPTKRHYAGLIFISNYYSKTYLVEASLPYLIEHIFQLAPQSVAFSRYIKTKNVIPRPKSRMH